MMNDTTVNGRPIKVGIEMGLVTVLKRPGGPFGAALPIADQSFSSPQDGSMQECYDKALAWAENN